VLNQNFDWQAPTPKPEEGFWFWDESNLIWLEQSTNNRKGSN